MGEALAEDRWRHDATTRALFPRPVPARAVVRAQARGILSGMAVVSPLARRAGIRVSSRLPDGTPVRPGTPVATLSGDARRILSIERPLLNFLMHLSGVATAAHRAVRAAHGARPTFRVRATRKTLPGLRALEKAAVRHGGADPNRSDLHEAVLIKNNHLALLSVPVALRRALRRHPASDVQIELRRWSEVEAALSSGARRLLLDNVAPPRLRDWVARVRARPQGRRVEIEASGRITARKLRAYARTGADAASLGGLTHSAPALPFRLTLRPLPGKPRR